MNKRQRKKAKQKALPRLNEAKNAAAKEYFESTIQDDLLLLQKLINEKETTFHPSYHFSWEKIAGQCDKSTGEWRNHNPHEPGAEI